MLLLNKTRISSKIAPTFNSLNWHAAIVLITRSWWTSSASI
nr:MAG TPA: hypothetical protein [Caudoviricetes sp.]